jgi:hypothetical protein
MTPRQLSAFAERLDRRQEREELLVGLLASVTANFSFCAPREPLCAADFVPGRKRSKPPELSEEEIAVQIDSILRPRAIVVGSH